MNTSDLLSRQPYLDLLKSIINVIIHSVIHLQSTENGAVVKLGY